MTGHICQSTDFFRETRSKKIEFLFSNNAFYRHVITTVYLLFPVKELVFNFVSFTPGFHNLPRSVLNVFFLELVPLRDEKNSSHAHQTGYWYLLGIPAFLIWESHPPSSRASHQLSVWSYTLETFRKQRNK